MPNLNVEFAYQEFSESCWAACGRLVMNAYQGQEIFPTDTAFASALGLQPDVIQDMRVVLTGSNMFNGIDDTDNIPPFETIQAQIDQGRPLIICISADEIPPGSDCMGGHYVIVYGYDSDDESITVIDPAEVDENTGPQVLAYDSEIYASPYGDLYWGVPYYTRAPI